MDIFDLFPMGGPGLPGERSARSPEEKLAAGTATLLLPTLNFLIVLFAGVAPHTTVALVLMPLLSAVLLFALARILGVSVGRGILFAICCAATCFVGNLGALLLAAIGAFYSNF
jgi:hypothetical protein